MRDRARAVGIVAAQAVVFVLLLVTAPAWIAGLIVMARARDAAHATLDDVGGLA